MKRTKIRKKLYRYSDANTYTDNLTLAEAQKFQRLQNGGTIEPMPMPATDVIKNERKRFVLRKRTGGYVIFDRRNNQAISYPIADRKGAQRFCLKFVGTV
jgi:hypothetical protein